MKTIKPLAGGLAQVAILRILTATILVLFAGTVAMWAGPAEDEALRQAARNLDLVAVKSALQSGANPNAAPGTPLAGAVDAVFEAEPSFLSPNATANAKAMEIANVLFSSGARIGPDDREILWFPIIQRNLELLSLLLDHGTTPTARIEGRTPAELAVEYKHSDVYDLLVSRGAIPVEKEVAAQLVFVEAAGNGDIATMRRMLISGASIDGTNVVGMTALINAVRKPILRRHDAETIWWLLDKKADPNVQGESALGDKEFGLIGGIPLHVFVAMNNPTLRGMDNFPEAKALIEETFTRLLKAGAKVSGMDKQGRTPLHVAAHNDNVVAAESLIRAGARLMARDAKGKTPLDYAESASMIALLKNHGATER